VLLAEDSLTARHAARRLLEALGYRVHAAGDGIEALELASSPDRRIDLLITDIVMPRLDGHSLARRFLALRPRVPVLFLSAHAARLEEEIAADGAHYSCLRKPYFSRDLAQRVREALDARV